MEEDWNKLAADYAGSSVAVVGQVDCTSDEGQPVCEDFDVQVRAKVDGYLIVVTMTVLDIPYSFGN